MPLSLPEPLYQQFADRLSGRMGLYFTKDRWPDLERGLLAVAAELGIADLENCVRSLLATEWSRPHIETLASHLTVGETYFFREPKSFEALSQHVLPELIGHREHAGRDIRIWSAACCTGEEAYSLAILFDRLIPDRTDWTIRILATDINPGFLRRAADGIYGEWSFRGVPDAIKRDYFTRTADGAYKIIPKIKKMVSFGYDNLVETANNSAARAANDFDVIFCRNVLMYFREDTTRRVIAHFHHVLKEEGWLFPSSVEGQPILFDLFRYNNFDGTTIYRKQSAVAAAPKPAMAEFRIAAPPPVRAVAPVFAAVAPPPPVSPERDPSLQAQALEAYGKGNYGEAVALLLPSLAAAPDNLASSLLLARSYANQGLLGEAKRWCERAIACDRLSAASHYFLALIEQEQGEPAHAAASLQRTLFLDPHFALAHFALANLARGEGRLDEAARHYRNTADLLKGRQAEEILPESEGMSVGRLLELAGQGAGTGAAEGKVRRGTG